MFVVVCFGKAKNLSIYSVVCSCYLEFDIAEQCIHFKATCNKTTAFVGTQSSRLVSLCSKFGHSLRVSGTVFN